MSVNIYHTAIENITKKLRSDLDEEEKEDSSQDHDSDFLDNEEEITNTDSILSLSELSFSQMDQLKVSRISIFKDNGWDFRQEGSPLYANSCVNYWDREISVGVSLLDKENKHLSRLLKMIAFYTLPQNACLIKVRSFNTSHQLISLLTNLGRFLYKHRVFVDTKGNGSFDNTAYLTEEHFKDFLEDEMKTLNSKNKFASQVKHWRGLSESKLIPVEYRLDFDPFSKEDYIKISKDYEDNRGVWLPISIDSLSVLVPHCIKMIEEYSKEIFKIYDVLFPTLAQVLKVVPFEWCEAIDSMLDMNLKILDLKSFRYTDHSQAKFSHTQLIKLNCAIRSHPEWHDRNSLYTSSLRGGFINHRSLIEIASKLGIDLDEVDKSIMYDLVRLRREAVVLVNELRNACVTILFLVTGMRQSEMYLLEAGDCWHVKNSKDDYRIKITVSKTSEGSTGVPVVLPIPEAAFKAFKCLECLTEKSRAWVGTNKLLVNITNGFGKETTSKNINSFLNKWSEDLGIEHIHSHQFRKTIAMFAIYQNPNNICLIRRLFTHNSLAMTLTYIVKMPGMAEEIKLAVIEQNKGLLAELLEAIEKNCIAGKGGKRIQKSVQDSKIFKASLNDDGWENYEQYVEILLQDGLNILHRTSFNAICLNTHSGLVHLGPESCNCNVVDCDWAAFTETSIEDLDTDIKFHLDTLTQVHSEEQDKFSRYIIRNCLERLSELKGWDAVNNQYPELLNMGA